MGGKGLSGLNKDLRYVRFVMNLRKEMTRKRERKREASRPARARTRASRAKGGGLLAKGGTHARAFGGRVAKGDKRPMAISAGTKLNLTGLRYGTPLSKEALAGLEEKNFNSYPEHGDYANLLNWYFRGGKVGFIPTISGRHWGMRMSELSPRLRYRKFIGDLHREIDRYKEQKKKQTTGGIGGSPGGGLGTANVKRSGRAETRQESAVSDRAETRQESAGSDRAETRQGSAGSDRAETRQGSAGRDRAETRQGSAGSNRSSGRKRPSNNRAAGMNSNGYPDKEFLTASELKAMIQYSTLSEIDNLMKNPRVIYTTRMIPINNIRDYQKYPPGTNFANLSPRLRYMKYVSDTREQMSRDRRRKYRKKQKVVDRA